MKNLPELLDALVRLREHVTHNPDKEPDKKWIFSRFEIHALDITIDTVRDCIHMTTKHEI